MKHKIKISLLLWLLFSVVIQSSALAEEWTEAIRVIDGDTFVNADGEIVRLLDINTPEIAYKSKPAEPFGTQAQRALQRMIMYKKVRLEFGPTQRDRHHRLLAHVYTENGLWINKELVRQGMAHIYSFADNRVHVDELLKVEAQARQKKSGLWSHQRWHILNANDAFPDGVFGKFYLVQGTVKEATRVRDVLYLNFGDDWRKDFTVEIHQKNWPAFRKANINPLKDYNNKKLLVRGRLKPVNGALITATHPEELTIITE